MLAEGLCTLMMVRMDVAGLTDVCVLDVAGLTDVCVSAGVSVGAIKKPRCITFVYLRACVRSLQGSYLLFSCLR